MDMRPSWRASARQSGLFKRLLPFWFRPPDWNIRATIFPRKYKLACGAVIRTAMVMRRFASGRWEYREATKAEMQEWSGRDSYW